LSFEVGPIFDARVRLPMERRPVGQRPEHLSERYNEILGTEKTRYRLLSELFEDMRLAGVSSAIVHAEYEFGDPADDLNEAVAQLVSEKPTQLTGFGTVSLERLRPERAVRQVQRVADLGLRGLNLQPAFFGIPTDHRLMYPIYAKASELGLIVALHTGINYSPRNPIKDERPILLDQVACDFSDLKLIACHGGWPWVAEMVAVARRHPNVMIELGGLAPRYIGQPGSGWEVLAQFMDTLIFDQVLYATDWPVFPMERAVREWETLPLRPENLQRIFSGNAARLLGLDTPVAGGVG
jgi:predicted TIM-barrel fold metal-dependent hydrolase